MAAYAASAYGRLTAARRMFSAAMASAWPEKPHWMHRKSDWEGRLALSMQPQAGQVREVLRGSTRTTERPTRRALYSTKVRS